MEPFNIKFGYGKKEVALTIIPAGNAIFKVIYYGGILGAVRYCGDYWELVPIHEIATEGMPLYKHDLTADRLDVVLDDSSAAQIGDEIEIAMMKIDPED